MKKTIIAKRFDMDNFTDWLGTWITFDQIKRNGVVVKVQCTVGSPNYRILQDGVIVEKCSMCLSDIREGWEMAQMKKLPESPYVTEKERANAIFESELDPIGIFKGED